MGFLVVPKSVGLNDIKRRNSPYFELLRSKANYIQVRKITQLSHRDRAAGCVSFCQKKKNGTGRHYFTDIIGLSSTTVTLSACKLSNSVKKNAK